MATPLNTLLGWVVTRWKPTVAQVKAWMTSYRHKDDLITINDVDSNLKQALQNAGASTDRAKLAYYISENDLPATGDTNVYYIITSNKKTYAWINNKYELVGGGEGALIPGIKNEIEVVGQNDFQIVDEAVTENKLASQSVSVNKIKTTGTGSFFTKQGDDIVLIDLPALYKDYQSVPWSPNVRIEYDEDVDNYTLRVKGNTFIDIKDIPPDATKEGEIVIIREGDGNEALAFGKFNAGDPVFPTGLNTIIVMKYRIVDNTFYFYL